MLCTIFETFLFFSVDYNIFLRTLSMPKKRKWRISASIFKIIGFINVKNRDKTISHLGTFKDLCSRKYGGTQRLNTAEVKRGVISTLLSQFP
jgi:hypothetical protein